MNSVLSQSYLDYEYLVIDGGSTDDSITIARSFNIQGERLHFVSEPDKGIYDAMNKGIRLAHGDYCIFLNSGDCFANNDVLQRVMDYGLNAEVCYGDAVFIYPHKEQRRIYPSCLSIDFFYYDSLCHQAIFYKTDTLRRIGGYDEHFQLIADWAMNVTLLRRQTTFMHIPLVVAHYDMGGRSATSEGLARCTQERNDYYHHHGLFYIHFYMYIKRKLHKLFKHT
ncbi:MAG: glycosyltransferase [Paludibacter sp.]|nr:glycosyltransferase [Paludibacter sp.]